jgi:hypothetical protein
MTTRSGELEDAPLSKAAAKEIRDGDATLSLINENGRAGPFF